MLLNEVHNLQKSGFLPYVMVDGELSFMFMVASDPNFGGDRPMLSKGHVEDGEDIKEAALREAEEELGLIRSNVISSFKAWSGRLEGMDAQYTLTIYAGEIKDKHKFNTPHFETKETVWLSLQQFRERGRKSHIPIVKQIHDQIVKEKGA